MPTAYCAPPPFKRNEWIVRYKKVKHNKFTASQHDVFKETQNKTKQINVRVYTPMSIQFLRSWTNTLICVLN